MRVITLRGQHSFTEEGGMDKGQKVRKDENVGCEWGREGPVQTLERKVGLAQGL